ncbi:hypothetical protein [Nonomuraea sp. NPDC050310]
MSDRPTPDEEQVDELIDELETHSTAPVASEFTRDCTALTWDCG